MLASHVGAGNDPFRPTQSRPAGGCGIRGAGSKTVLGVLVVFLGSVLSVGGGSLGSVLLKNPDGKNFWTGGCWGRKKGDLLVALEGEVSGATQ